MKDERTKPYRLALAAYFTVGCTVITANTVLPAIEEEAGLLHSQSAMLITFLSVGNLIMGMIGNMLIEKTGRRMMLCLYAGFIALSFLLFALLPGLGAWCILMLFAGFGWGGINSLNNTVVAELYDGSASRLNILHAAYAVGAIVFPLIVGFMTRAELSWRVPVLMVSGLAALLFFLSLVIHMPVPQSVTLTAEEKPMAFYREAGFYIAVATFFTYVGVETAAGAWLSGYMSGTNHFFAKNVPAQTMVSLMWFMMLVGRLLFSAVGMHLDKSLLLIVLSCGYLLGMLGIVFLSASTPLAILSVAIMGLSMSAIYATAVANFTRYITGSALAAGIILGAGGLGSAIIPILAGKIADLFGLQAGMVSLSAFLVLLVIATVLSRKVTQKEA